MANLNETATWETGIYQWETSDPVQGGPNGIDNKPTRQLANRTLWLKTELAKAVASIGKNKTDAENMFARKSTTVTAGAGLTGGGTLGGNMQFALGTPGTCSGNTTNWAGSNTHTHQLAAASPTVAGVAKLINNLTTDDADSALSAKMGKKLNDDKLNKTDLKFYRAPVLAGSQAVTLDLTNRQSIIDNFGDKYIVYGHLQMVLHNNADNHRITGLPLDGQKGAVQLDFYLMGGFSYVECHYVALNRTFRTSVNWNNETLQLRWKENLNEDNGLGSKGNQTLLNGRFSVQTENNSWAQIAAKSSGDGWIFEVGPEGEGQFTRRRKDAFATHTGNIAVYKLPAGGTGTHVLATESQIGFVKPVIKPATSEIIDLTKKSEILAYAGTSGNKHIQLTFYNNSSSQIVGLPIEDKSPCQMDISIMGAYTVCRVYYFYLRREFVSSVNWNSEELSYRWDETANKNTAVMLAGNQDVAGNKKFLGRTEFAGGVKMTNDTRSVEVGVGSSDVYIGNLTTRKFVQLKDDGTLAYSNVKIMLASDKSDAVNLDDSNKIATAKAVKVVNDKIEQAAPSGTVAYFAGRNAPAGWLKANGAAVSRTTYAALFAAIGTTYGAGDGRTTFNLPDLRGEFVRGFDDGRNIDRGRALGSAQNQSMSDHYHGIGVMNTTDDILIVNKNWSGGGNEYPVMEMAGEYNKVLKGRISSTRLIDGGTLTDGGRAYAPGNGSAFHAERVHHIATAMQDLSGNSSETRPRNVALLACIKI